MTFIVIAAPEGLSYQRVQPQEQSNAEERRRVADGVAQSNRSDRRRPQLAHHDGVYDALAIQPSSLKTTGTASATIAANSRFHCEIDAPRAISPLYKPASCPAKPAGNKGQRRSWSSMEWRLHELLFGKQFQQTSQDWERKTALPLRPVAKAENPGGQQEIGDGVRRDGIAHAALPPERGGIGKAGERAQQQMTPILQVLHVHQAKGNGG